MHKSPSISCHCCLVSSWIMLLLPENNGSWYWQNDLVISQEQFKCMLPLPTLTTAHTLSRHWFIGQLRTYLCLLVKQSCKVFTVYTGIPFTINILFINIYYQQHHYQVRLLVHFNITSQVHLWAAQLAG